MEEANERERFIEDSGLMFEALGTTRMVGRIFGYVAIAPEGRVTFDELVTGLRASKSTISTNLKTLVQINFLRPITFPGDRRTYYSLDEHISWASIMRQRLKMIDYMLALFNKGIELRDGKSDGATNWLRRSISFYQFIMEKFPNLMEEWEAENKI